MSKFFLSVIFLVVTSCSLDPVKNEFRIYHQHKKSKKYKLALKSLNKILLKKTTEKHKEKALIEKAYLLFHHTQGFKELIDVYQDLYNLTQVPVKKIDYKLLKVDVYVNKLGELERPIKELNDLKLKYKNVKQIEVQQKLIELYIKKKSYYQASVELKQVLKLSDLPLDKTFALKALQAEVLALDGKENKAIVAYETLIEEHPTKAKFNEVHISLLNLYESENKIKKALKLIGAMKGHYPDKKDYLISKEKRYKELMRNMPGAKGLIR